MPETPNVNSCDLCITEVSVTPNGTPLQNAGPVAAFRAMLGDPTRILPAGLLAPVGHLNDHIHFYDHLGLTLNEHHYTYQSPLLYTSSH